MAATVEPGMQDQSYPAVQLLCCCEDPQLFKLHVRITEQVGFLFRLCELLLKHTFDVISGDIAPEGPCMHLSFTLQQAEAIGLREKADKVTRLGRELQEFVQRCETTEPPRPEDPRLLERLSVSADLLSVSAFHEVTSCSAALGEHRYELELQGINQAGLVAYLALVFFRSGFTIMRSHISVPDNLLAFELSTASASACQAIRTYLDIPYAAELPHGLGRSRASSDCSGGKSPRGSCQGQPSAGDRFSELLWAQLSTTDSTPRAGPFQLPNGDIYEGECLQLKEGARQHGYGTYTYKGQRDAAYKQYRGQWREGKKHGHGVLFLRSGGTYVGQWADNQKRGFGVMLDYSGPETAASMPSYSYEGEWSENTMEGIGVEDTTDSVFFGSFHKGKRHGRGVKVSFEDHGRVTGCEVLDGTTWLPLLEALESKRVPLGNPDGAPQMLLSTPVDALGLEPGNLITAGLVGDADSTCASGADTGASSSFTESPRPRMPPVLAPNSVSRTGSPRHERQPAAVSRTASLWMGSPKLAAQASPGLPPSAEKLVRQVSPVGASSQWMGSPRLRPQLAPGMLPSPGSQLRRHAAAALPLEGGAGSRSAPASPRSCSGSAGPADEAADNESVEFLMLEESGYITPTLHTPPGKVCATPQETLPQKPPDAVSAPTVKPLLGPEGGVSSPSGSGVAPSPNRSAPSARIGRASRPVLCPMLWSEDELAAFLSCLGLSQQVVASVQQRKLKGVGRLVEMPDAELRREFGLASQAEQHIVRKALKRFLELDRWENAVQGRRLAGATEDPVLGAFRTQPGELTREREEFSQGGFGRVYRGTLRPIRSRGRLTAGKEYRVAVKDMKGDRQVHLHEHSKEGCVMASLNHPNLCMFVGIYVDECGRHYILSELMDCSLFDLIHQPHKLNWQDELTVGIAMALTEGICAGVGYLHSKKLVHADLKSSNILIDFSSQRDLVPKICDFGHVAMRAHPAPHHRCGTPHWAAPEALRNEALGPAADVFSCGVILWEMLTQTLPHRSLTFAQVMGAVGWAGWAPDLEMLPEVPGGLREVLTSCLSFMPVQRPVIMDLRKQIRRIRRHTRSEALGMLVGFLDGRA